MDNQENTQGLPQAPETDQLKPAQEQQVPASPQPTPKEPEPSQEEVTYDYLADADIEPKDVEKPEINEDMTEDEIEKANQEYEVKKANQRSLRSEIKADITDFLSSVDNPEIYREYRKDVEKVAQLEGAEKFTTEGLFHLVGGKKLVNDLVRQSVAQIRQIDTNNRSNVKPNTPPDKAPDGMPDFLNMSNEEFREYKAKVTSGAIMM